MRIYPGGLRPQRAYVSQVREAHQSQEVQAPHRALREISQTSDEATATGARQLLHAHVNLKTPSDSGLHRCPGRIAGQARTKVSMLPCHGSDPGSKSHRRKSRPGRLPLVKERFEPIGVRILAGPLVTCILDDAPHTTRIYFTVMSRVRNNARLSGTCNWIPKLGRLRRIARPGQLTSLTRCRRRMDYSIDLNSSSKDTVANFVAESLMA